MSEEKPVRVGRFSGYILISEEDVRSTLGRLGVKYDTKRCAAALKRYRDSKNILAVAVLCFWCVWFITWLSVFLDAQWISEQPDPLLVVLIRLGILVAMWGLAAALLELWQLVDPASQRLRYFRALGRAVKVIPNVQDELVSSTHWISRLSDGLSVASRAMFSDLQSKRMFWRSAPMLSDWALNVSVSLIDVDINREIFRRDENTLLSLRYLVRDLCIVALMGREDLIPEVRSSYDNIRARYSDKSKSDRDRMYLNAMKDRGRWDVVKDLAPWLSLIVATAALGVSIVQALGHE